MSSNVKSAVAHPEAGRTNLYRIAIVGAATLKGKEIAEVLSDRNFPSADIKLLDDDESLGQLETAGEEISFIQSVRAEQFEHVDFTFFACDQDCTRTNWKTAQKAGSAIVDLSFALEDVPEAMLRAPWIERQLGQVLTPELQPRPVVIAHPAAAGRGRESRYQQLPSYRSNRGSGTLTVNDSRADLSWSRVRHSSGARRFR